MWRLRPKVLLARQTGFVDARGRPGNTPGRRSLQELWTEGSFGGGRPAHPSSTAIGPRALRALRSIRLPADRERDERRLQRRTQAPGSGRRGAVQSSQAAPERRAERRSSAGRETGMRRSRRHAAAHDLAGPTPCGPVHPSQDGDADVRCESARDGPPRVRQPPADGGEPGRSHKARSLRTNPRGGRETSPRPWRPADSRPARSVRRHGGGGRRSTSNRNVTPCADAIDVLLGSSYLSRRVAAIPKVRQRVSIGQRYASFAVHRRTSRSSREGQVPPRSQATTRSAVSFCQFRYLSCRLTLSKTPIFSIDHRFRILTFVFDGNPYAGSLL